MSKRPVNTKRPIATDGIKNFLNTAPPDITEILLVIKQIQKRMLDADMLNLEYIYVYDALGKEFTEFSDRHPHIFTKVIRGENLNTLAATLFYKAQVDNGLISEQKIRDALADKYLPADLKKLSYGQSNN